MPPGLGLFLATDSAGIASSIGFALVLVLIGGRLCRASLLGVRLGRNLHLVVEWIIGLFGHRGLPGRVGCTRGSLGSNDLAVVAGDSIRKMKTATWILRLSLCFCGLCLIGFPASSLRAANLAPKAYAIAEINVTDPVSYKEYLAAVTPIVARFGGKYIVRAGQIVPIEGDAPTGRFVVIEFSSLAIARRFESSPEYRSIAPLRQKAARTRLFLVEGVPNN